MMRLFRRFHFSARPRRRTVAEALEARRLLAADLAIDDFETDPRLLAAFHGPIFPGRPIPPIQGWIAQAGDDFPASNTDAQATPSPPPPFPTDQTFRLHSRPDSDFTIYLDFDGHVTTGTSWNSNYNVDQIVHPNWWGGSGSNVSGSRLELIQEVWQIVAEDFAPFDVNVTTEEPLDLDDLRYSGSGDLRWGTRAVMTKDTFADCGCGGHAYLGSFDDRQDEPALVYNGGRGAGSETISHEIGHQLGLRHDGKGPNEYYSGHGSDVTSWGPIMGSPFSKKVTQWNAGDYFDATRTRQDDLAVITGSSNIPYRNDDHADDFSAATPLNESESVNVEAFGIIERNDDVDWFRFVTGGGQISIDVDVLGYKPNLDVWAGLYDDAGNFVMDANPQDSLSAGFRNVTLEAGEYFIAIDGVARDGAYDPLLDRYVEPDPPPYTVSGPIGYSGYGSLGQYRISGTVTATSAATVSITADQTTVFEGGVATVTLTASDGGDAEVGVLIRPAGQAVPGQPAPDGTEPDDLQIAATQTVSLVGGVGVLQIPISEDSRLERDESFEVVIVDSGAYHVADRVATVQVAESLTALAILSDQVIGREGDTGASTQTFTVRRMGRSDSRLTVGWRRSSHGNDPADAADFVSAAEGTLTLESGQESGTVQVQIAGDLVPEADESYAIELFALPGQDVSLVPSRGSAVGRIRDDESVITFSTGGSPTPISFVENNSGTQLQSITVERTGFLDKAVSVDWAITPTGPSPVDAVDFGGLLPSGTLSLASGESSATIDFAFNGDTESEDDETFLITLSNHSGGTIDGSTLLGTILNDDFNAPEIQVSGEYGQPIADGDVSPTFQKGTDFLLTEVNGAFPTRLFDIANIGVSDLTITSIGLQGPAADDFQIVYSGQSVLAPGQSTTIEVAFAPLVAGRRDAELVINNDDPDEAVYSFALTGLASDLRVQDVVVNEGRSSRSQIGSVRVTFNQVVNHQELGRAFRIYPVGYNQFYAPLNVNPRDVDGRTEVTLALNDQGGTGSPVGEGTFFRDGHYALRVSASMVITSGDDPYSMYQDYLFGTDSNGGIDASDAFFRLFGDSDGDADVDVQDFGMFAAALASDPAGPKYDALLDYEQDGDIDNRDLAELRRRLGSRL